MLLRRLVHPGLLLITFIVTAGVFTPAVAVDAPSFHLTVVSNEPGHLSWEAASRLVEAAAENGLEIQPRLAARPGEKKPGAAAPDLLLMPLRSLATQVPAFEVLELPFLFTDIDTVHQAFDSELGKLLHEQARRQGWEVLALWDEGMHVLSGQRRYDRAINLTGMEFILLRPDPVAEKQFRALDAWTRSAQPQTREQLLRECAIGSRSASLQQIWHERLDRVHLAVSLTAHRYEGWVVIAPAEPWNKQSDRDRSALLKALASTTQWQRSDARRRESEALQALKTSGMQIHILDAEQRKTFMKLLPAWETLLSEKLEQSLRQKLVAAATAGITGRSDREALPNTQPATPDG